MPPQARDREREGLGRYYQPVPGSLIHIGRRPAATRPSFSDDPDWQQASPARIDRAMAAAKRRCPGGWLVVDASDRIEGQPRPYRIDGRELVVWRAQGRTFAAPASCPHMGAALTDARCDGVSLVCPWHGLRLCPDRGHGRWRGLPTFDDGVLTWVRAMGDEAPTDAPIVPHRPGSFAHGVTRVEARCEPEDIIANRFDPWHGTHYHPHSFAALRVLELDDDVITLRVSYRVAGPVCVEVDATFHAPSARCIVMTIVDGEGTGSVVETHATPLGPGHTMVTEATLATSERTGFWLASRARKALRRFIERRAHRLWVEDAAYAERRYALRRGRCTG